MQKVALLMSLGLIFNSSAAVAAAPVFQLKARDGGQLLAIDAYPSRPQQDTVQSMRTRNASESSFESASASVSGDAMLSGALYNAASNDGPHLIPAGFAARGARPAGAELPGRPRLATVSAASKDALFYFLKNFKARRAQQPAHWTLFLVGLCFVLYQIRRRPMRTSIGFRSAARLIGGRGAGAGVGAGAAPIGAANAVSA